jgi:hypothetical protein
MVKPGLGVVMWRGQERRDENELKNTLQDVARNSHHGKQHSQDHTGADRVKKLQQGQTESPFNKHPLKS